jgi:hypothetical protein
MMNWRPSHETFYTLGVICLICDTGLHQTFKERRRYQERRTFANEFRSQFFNYVRSGGKDFAAYTWLIASSTQMQGEMGRFGIYDHFRGPGFQATNFPIIMNGLPGIRDWFGKNQRDRGIWQDQINAYIQLVDDAMVRYLGSLKYALTHSQSPWNPVIWFREGIKAWLASPMTLLSWFGVISATTLSRLVGGKPFEAFTAIATLLGFVGTIFTLALGWEDMHKLIWKLLRI